ncbi:MAG: DUF6785 family protein, partial [Planctomycetota bacterium]
MSNRFPWRALLTGSLFVVFVAYASIVACNRMSLYFPSTQFSSLSFLFAIILVLAVNPVLRLLRLRPFSLRETMLVLIMTLVSAGIPVFGYICEVIPMAAGLHNPAWNTPQSEWEDKVVPALDPQFFVGTSLFNVHDVEDWSGLCDELAKGAEEATSPLRRSIWTALANGKLSGSEKNLQDSVIAVGKNGSEPSDEFKLSLCREVRRQLAQAELAPKGTAPDLIEVVNREAFEKDLAGAVRVSDIRVRRRAMEDLLKGVGIHNKQAFPPFVKRDDENTGQFLGRFFRYFTASPSLKDQEFRNWHAFYLQLHKRGQSLPGGVEGRLWSQLSEGSRTK